MCDLFEHCPGPVAVPLTIPPCANELCFVFWLAVGAEVKVIPPEVRAKQVAKAYGGSVLELPPDPEEEARRRRAKAAAKARRNAGEGGAGESSGAATHRQFLEGMLAAVNAEVCVGHCRFVSAFILCVPSSQLSPLSTACIVVTALFPCLRRRLWLSMPVFCFRD